MSLQSVNPGLSWEFSLLIRRSGASRMEDCLVGAMARGQDGSARSGGELQLVAAQKGIVKFDEVCKRFYMGWAFSANLNLKEIIVIGGAFGAKIVR